MSDKEKETERKRENYNCEAKQGVQGLGRCYALGNLFKFLSPYDERAPIITECFSPFPHTCIHTSLISLLAWPLPFLL